LITKELPVILRLRLATVLGTAAFILLVAHARLATAQIPAGNTIYACFRIDRDGDEGKVTRLVAANEPCRRNEIRIQWNVAGPNGNPGPAGPQGPVGPQGAAGPAGPAGPTGPQGLKGDAGLQGPKGDTGPQGPQGTQGPQGASGQDGLNGLGLRYRGNWNSTDASYAQNDVVSYNGSAYIALPEIASPTAPPDTIGSGWALMVMKGDKGDAGPQGPQGIKGDTGATGPTGPQGPAGSAGSNGTNGTNGTNGSSVTVAGAPLANCPTGGAAVSDAFGNTQYVCDGPAGPAGSGNANGTAGEVAFFSGPTSVVSSPNYTWDNVNKELAVTSGSANSPAIEGQSQVAGSGGANVGVLGIANNNTTASIGVDGETTTTRGTGVRGLASGAVGDTVGVWGLNESTVGGNNKVTYGVIGQNAATAAASGTTHIGVYGTASGASFNAGLFVGSGETVISNSNTISSTPQLPRSANGSIFTQVASTTQTGGRIWWASAGFVFWVNSTGSADVSEFFSTTDATLGVGEVVALDPEHANGVRRARPRDAGSTVGIVSLAGTRYNDTSRGDRDQDPNYINVGLVGQVPVLITLENGPIRPGDALTVSTRLRGRATKAMGPGRIIGYATTHFPYVEGEKDYLDDIVGGSAQRLQVDHVMVYLNVGWYQPTDVLGDGEEPAPVESARATQERLNTTLGAPGHEQMGLDNTKVRDSVPTAQPAKPTETPTAKKVSGPVRSR
jgi:hypothetical protein